MSNNIVKKNKLYYVGILLLCSYSQVRASSNSLCSYFFHYYVIDIFILLKEIHNFILVTTIKQQQIQFSFLISKKIYFYVVSNNSFKNLICEEWYPGKMSCNFSFTNVKASIAICYYKKSELKLLSMLKKLKFLCIGSISFKDTINIMDWIIPMGKSFFGDTYILHSFLKRLIKYKCLS